VVYGAIVVTRSASVARLRRVLELEAEPPGDPTDVLLRIDREDA